MASDNKFLIEEIKNCFESNKPLEQPFHKQAIELYKNYLFVGGMPEVVEEYLNNKNFDFVKIKQQSILDSYFNDMGKYNKESEIPKTKLVTKTSTLNLPKKIKSLNIL